MPNLTVKASFYIPPFPWDLDALPYVALEDYGEAPPIRCVYFMRTEHEVLYIGATTSLHQRFTEHHRLPEIQDLPGPFAIAWMPFPHASPIALAALERKAILHYRPLLNVCGNHRRMKDTITRKKQTGKPYAKRVRERLARLFPGETKPSLFEA